MVRKNPTTWIPQPEGFGYVTTIAAKKLVTQTGVALVDQNGAALLTGTTSVAGKFVTPWSDTGA